MAEVINKYGRNPSWTKLKSAWRMYYRSKQRKDLESCKVLAIQILKHQHDLVWAVDKYMKDISIFKELLA